MLLLAAMRPLRVGTRGSLLALRQTALLRQQLQARWPQQAFTVVTITEAADRQPEAPLEALGGEGVFVKALEAALQEERIDCAVHSLKDVPLHTGQGLTLGAILKRDDPRDALVAANAQTFAALPAGARLGTSSLRRRSQLRRLRPDLAYADMRGNVDTRLRKLDRGEYAAIVLAACGLERLGLQARITERFPVTTVIPEPGQGAIAVEARAQDAATLALLQPLDDPATRACVTAERAFLEALGGGCRVPIAAFAQVQEGCLHLEGTVVSADGAQQVRVSAAGAAAEAAALGQRLGQQAAARGALDLLKIRV